MNHEYQNPSDALFDEDNNDVLILFNERGEEVPFEQIAIIPLGKTYAILKPVQPLEGMGEDEGLVFAVEVNTETNEEYLALVTDMDIIDQVFDVYDALVEEGQEPLSTAQRKSRHPKRVPAMRFHDQPRALSSR